MDNKAISYNYSESDYAFRIETSNISTAAHIIKIERPFDFKSNGFLFSVTVKYLFECL